MILPSNIFLFVIFLHSWSFLTWASGDIILPLCQIEVSRSLHSGDISTFPLALRGDDGLNSFSLLIEICRLTALGWG